VSKSDSIMKKSSRAMMPAEWTNTHKFNPEIHHT